MFADQREEPYALLDPANDPGPPRLQITPEDLRRYAAGTLAVSRRRTVEGFLACNPDLAAQVMADLHRAAPSDSRARARRGRRIAGGILALVLAASGASAYAGWTAAERHELDGWREADGDAPPEYVEEAAESRHASQVRAAMTSQVETARLDVAEIRRALQLDLPRLPADWRIVDVQVYPTDEGPSVNLSAVSARGDRLTLFVVRAKASATARPELARRGREVVAFWERGQSAYVLSGGATEALLSHAVTLASARNL